MFKDSKLSGCSLIAGYARTPFGKSGGVLKDFSAVELGSIAVREAVKRSYIDLETVEYAILGQVISAGCGQIPARQAVINAGLSPEVPVDQINKVCASSMRALEIADTMIRAGDADVIITGGMESMSNAPFASSQIRWGHKMFNFSFEDLMIKDGLWCPHYDVHMAVHAGKTALENGITRKMQDEWAVESQRRAHAAIEKGYIAEEIVDILTEKGNISRDESPRLDTSIEKLEKLKPLFTEDNTVTAGNAPGVNDGGAAVVLMSEQASDRYGVTPKAKILGYAMVSEDPANIATAPGKAICKLLDKNNLKSSEIGLFEINEAFAAVALLSAKIAEIPLEKLNVNGGAIAYGHPLGASGSRIIMTLVNEMKRRNVRYGIAAICSGMGQGDAVLIKNE